MSPNPSRVYSPHHRPIIGVLRWGIVTLFGKLSVREDDKLVPWGLDVNLFYRIKKGRG